MNQDSQPVALLILSGFGIYKQLDFYSYTKNLNRFVENYPAAALSTQSSLHTGRVNSRLGHQMLGSGRNIFSIENKISNDIEEGIFFEKKGLNEIKEDTESLHLVGLISPGSELANINHCLALVKYAQQHDIQPTLHLIVEKNVDSHDELEDLINKLIQQLDDPSQLASIMSREYAMNEKFEWNKIKSAANTIISADAEKRFSDPVSFLKKIKQKDFTTAVNSNLSDDYKIRKDDVLFFFNYKGRGIKNLVKAFCMPVFKFDLALSEVPTFTLTEYEEDIPVEEIYLDQIIHNTLSEAVRKNNLYQAYITETVNHPYLNYYFKGNKAGSSDKEEIITVSSKNIGSFDKHPEMSIKKLRKKVIEAIQSKNYNFIVLDIPNFKLTSTLKAKRKSLKAIDKTIGKIVENILVQNGVCAVVADYKQNINSDSKNKHLVPFILIGNQFKGVSFNGVKVPNSDLTLANPAGHIMDVAPTILKFLDIDIPNEMKGEPFELLNN